MLTRFPSNSLTKMIKKPLIVTTDTLSKFSLTKFLMENFDSDNGPLNYKFGKKIAHKMTVFKYLLTWQCNVPVNLDYIAIR